MNYYNYFSEVEEHFVRRRGKHMWVTPLDWHLIEIWKNSGVPLNVALRGIDIAMDSYLSKQHRPNDKLNTLAYCHDSVMQEYARHLEAHVGGDSTENGPEKAEADDLAGPGKETVIQYLEARISEIESLHTKLCNGESLEGLDRALSRLTEIAAAVLSHTTVDHEALERDLALLDDVLVGALITRVPEEQSRQWDDEAKAELKIYKKRLPKETFQKIRHGFMRGKIHQYFKIGDLSLFHL